VGSKRRHTCLFLMCKKDSDEWSGMKQALQCAVEETGIAAIVKTAPDAGIRRPSRVNRSSIQRFQVGGPSHAFYVCFLDRG
jgi:hypothetical protein